MEPQDGPLEDDVFLPPRGFQVLCEWKQGLYIGLGNLEKRPTQLADVVCKGSLLQNVTVEAIGQLPPHEGFGVFAPWANRCLFCSGLRQKERLEALFARR